MNARNKIASLMGGAAMVATVVGMTVGMAPSRSGPKTSRGEAEHRP